MFPLKPLLPPRALFVAAFVAAFFSTPDETLFATFFSTPDETLFVTSLACSLLELLPECVCNHRSPLDYEDHQRNRHNDERCKRATRLHNARGSSVQAGVPEEIPSVMVVQDSNDTNGNEDRK